MVPLMNKQKIKGAYKRRKKELKLEFKTGKTQRKYAHKIRKAELKFQKRSAEKDEKKRIKKAIRAEKREFKKEAYLQKAIYLEKRDVLKKKLREELGSLTRIVTDHAPESLVGSLTLSYVLIFLVFALLQSIFVTAAAHYTVDRRAEEEVITLAGTLEAGGLNREMAERVAAEDAVNISLYDAQGVQVYSTGLAHLEGKLPYNQTWEEPFSYRHQTETLLIYSKKVTTQEGDFSLNLAKSMQAETAMLSLIVNLMLISVALVLCISYFVGYRTARKQLRPIGVLGRAMEEMSAARLSDRLETEHIRSELVEVVNSYNHMLDKIEGAYERQKQFVADASHELRTPLAVIHGYADILSRWGAEEPAVREEAVEAILAQSTNMQELLERLLYIARSENGKTKAEPQETDLAPLAGELLQDFRLIHPERAFILEGAGTAWCDPSLVRQILTILLDNAVKFTAEDGRIAVTLEEGKLTVSDNGVGMETEVAAQIFERFYKGDSSHNEKGYGLGLSIAKLMMEQQGGTISVHSTPGEGSAFTLKFAKKNTEVH